MIALSTPRTFRRRPERVTSHEDAITPAMELASRQSGAWWFIRSNQSRGQRGWFMGGIERKSRQPHTHFSHYDRGECDLAA